MKFVVYGDEKRLGILAGAYVVDASRAYTSYLGDRRSPSDAASLVPADLRSFIEAGPDAIARCGDALAHLGVRAHERPGLAFPLGEARLHAPRAREARIACAGANFADHAMRMAAKVRGRDVPALTPAEALAAQRKEGIRGFWKLGRETAGPGEDVIYPAKARRLDYEGELAVIIGRRGKDIRAEDASRHIWGATLLIDWSIRAPREDNPATRFAMTKNFDTSCSLGPLVAVGELDPFDAEIETLVNGERRQHFSTRDMVYSFAEFIAHLSEDFTLYPGDVISGGTAAGTAADSSPRLPDGTQPNDLFLKPGDSVEVKNPAIGSLKARVVAKAGSA